MKIRTIYPHGFPQCYLPTELKIFKIPIRDYTEFVYMVPNKEYLKTHIPIFVAAELFLEIWKDAPRFDSPPFFSGVTYASVPHLWQHDRKLKEGWAENGFSYGLENPVPTAVIERLHETNLYLTNGITRTLWLLINNVKAFPILCPVESARQLIDLAGCE